MATAPSGVVLRHLRQLVNAKDTRTIPDQQLLERFTRGREEAAFEALVRRHGPLVLCVCRRVLHQEQDAEDVFQATFLVLARKAAGIDQRVSLGGWLYRVAYHLALKVRKQAAARQKREERAARRDETDPLAEVTGRELLAVFDEELQELPECERVALVLCYLEGKTRDEAAREVGCSESTLKRRLERGKERMRLRLARRGVALSAALLPAGLAQSARAAVPTALTVTAVQAGLLVAGGQTASGVASAKAVALANGAIRAMVLSRVKTVGALLLAAALLGLGGVLLASPRPEDPAPPAPAAREDTKVAPAAELKPADDKKLMTVTGRVLDADGKPLADAEVAVLARPKATHGGDPFSRGVEVLGRGKTDAEGRFRLEVLRTSSLRYAGRNSYAFMERLPSNASRTAALWFPGVAVVARTPDHALGWQSLDPDAEKPTADLRLTREQVIRGRFVDLQGEPAAGVTVRIAAIGKSRAAGLFDGVSAPAQTRDLPVWPKAAVTDRDGRFELHGVAKDGLARLSVSDDRFATQSVEVAADAREGEKEYKTTLEPAHLIEGTVTGADTGKPIPGARLSVSAGKLGIYALFELDARADEKGRFRVNPTPGNAFVVTAFAPDSTPYLPLRTQLRWPKAAVKQQLDLKLPRGVLVCGKVVEAASGKTVARASVQFHPRAIDNPNFRSDIVTGWDTAVVSDEDGKFTIGVLPGPGHLLIHGPTPDYVLSEIGQRKLYEGKDGGTRYRAAAIVPLDLKDDAESHDVTVKLQRGVTVKGRLVGPDGKPVAEALVFSRLSVSPATSTVGPSYGTAEWPAWPLHVSEGRFELRGCDPEKSSPVLFLDSKNKAGAMVELSRKQAGEEVTVRLAPCGEATVRLFDADGKPQANRRVVLDLVITPGPHRLDRKAIEKGELAADEVMVSNFDFRNMPLTDDEGRVTFPALIPGATYRIVELLDRDDIVKCEFKAESGKTLKLPDLVRKK
jgi:RNA polymerase sigma factor (sigma-70 family)